MKAPCFPFYFTLCFLWISLSLLHEPFCLCDILCLAKRGSLPYFGAVQDLSPECVAELRKMSVLKYFAPQKEVSEEMIKSCVSKLMLPMLRDVVDVSMFQLLFGYNYVAGICRRVHDLKLSAYLVPIMRLYDAFDVCYLRVERTFFPFSVNEFVASFIVVTLKLIFGLSDVDNDLRRPGPFSNQRALICFLMERLLAHYVAYPRELSFGPSAAKELSSEFWNCVSSFALLHGDSEPLLDIVAKVSYLEFDKNLKNAEFVANWNTLKSCYLDASNAIGDAHDGNRSFVLRSDVLDSTSTFSRYVLYDRDAISSSFDAVYEQVLSIFSLLMDVNVKRLHACCEFVVRRVSEH